MWPNKSNCLQQELTCRNLSSLLGMLPRSILKRLSGESSSHVPSKMRKHNFGAYILTTESEENLRIMALESHKGEEKMWLQKCGAVELTSSLHTVQKINQKYFWFSERNMFNIWKEMHLIFWKKCISNLERNTQKMERSQNVESRAVQLTSSPPRLWSKACRTNVKAQWERFDYFLEICTKLAKAQQCIIGEEHE